jgi:transcriptional regulator with XRE-family HTH domain
MTSDELRAARAALGLSLKQFGLRCGLTGNNVARTVRAMEAEEKEISDRMAAAVRALVKDHETKNDEHVGSAVGGPKDGEVLRSAASHINIPILCSDGYGQISYDWFNGQWFFRDGTKQ